LSKSCTEFLSEIDKESSEVQKRKGGPQTEFQRIKRQNHVSKLYFEYGYTAVKISELLKVNRNTINSDIGDLYLTFEKNWVTQSTISILQNNVISLMAQKSRLREELDIAKNLSEKLAIEKMILQIEITLHKFHLLRGEYSYSKAIQVKGSRSYNPRKSELKRYGEGRTTWNVISGESVFNPENRIDFFVFVLHIDEITTKKRRIIQQYLIIPIEDFRKLTKKKQVRKNGTYHYFFWISLDNKEVLEINNKVNQDKMDYTKYLNNFDLLKF